MKKLLLFLGVAALAWSCDKDDDRPSVTYAVLDFENVPILAGPTIAGENLYSADNPYYPYGPDLSGYNVEFPNYTGYTDNKTGLKMTVNIDAGYEGATGKPEFWSGGIAPSQWKDMTTRGIANQCSVYDANGGHGGSKTFGLVFAPTALSFDSGVEKEVESLWVTNTTYAALDMINNDIEDEEGWFMLTLEGFSAAGNSTGKIDFYLADFRSTSTKKGLVTAWTKVDLKSLGKVNNIKFSFTGSDTGEWGLNTPGYVCIDDVRVIVE